VWTDPKILLWDSCRSWQNSCKFIALAEKVAEHSREVTRIAVEFGIGYCNEVPVCLLSSRRTAQHSANLQCNSNRRGDGGLFSCQFLLLDCLHAKATTRTRWPDGQMGTLIVDLSWGCVWNDPSMPNAVTDFYNRRFQRAHDHQREQGGIICGRSLRFCGLGFRV